MQGKSATGIGRTVGRRYLSAVLVGATAFLGLPFERSRALDETAAVFARSTYSSPIALSADNRLLWVVNPNHDTVSVLRTDTNSVITTIAVGDEPRSVALDPNNGFAYVANAVGSSVTVIRVTNSSFGGFQASVLRTIVTGAEPWDVAISPNGRRVFVANSAQDTISVINAQTHTLIGQVNLRNSRCNDPDRRRHFQPRGLAITQDSKQLYTARFLSFTKPNGRQGVDNGREGVVCRLDINTNSDVISGYQPALRIRLRARDTGFKVDSSGDGVDDATAAFPNQLQAIVLRGNRGYLPNIAASPSGPLKFNVDTHAFLNLITGVGSGTQLDLVAVNLHLGARQPEPGKKRLFFANPWAMAFTTQSGPGSAYVVSAGSDLLVKLNVDSNGLLSFTVDGDTTRYIDLNDPANPATSGANAGKNPVGIAINSAGTRAYVANHVSGNVSFVNLTTDSVVKVVRTAPLPPSGSAAERILVGAEMFFSSRGHFNRPAGTVVSTDERLSSEGWQNCASCHFNGWTDSVVWAFGSGPRKSVNLAGSFNPRQRSQQKILNYSGIFDEIEDFEANIRNVSGPGNGPPLACETPPPPESAFDRNHGLLIGDNGNINRAPCVINALAKANGGRQQVKVNPLGPTQAVNALTALKLWIQFAVRVPNGPLNSNQIAGGVPVGVINAGRALFLDQQCTNCHTGGLWSISDKDFVSPPPGNQIACEVNLAAAAPAGSFCTTAPVFGNPVGVQYLRRFIRNVGSFNLGVPGQGNPIPGFPDIGAVEKASAALVNGVAQPAPDALGLDYNNDGFGRGYSPQSLLGIHAVQPYMHNGACETLLCVVNDVEHRTANGTLPDRLGDPADRARLVRFLESIDAQTPPFN
jgi:YVTN family beta-propeller protein